MRRAPEVYLWLIFIKKEYDLCALRCKWKHGKWGHMGDPLQQLIADLN